MTSIGQAVELKESKRTYYFPKGEQVELENVVELAVRDSGTQGRERGMTQIYYLKQKPKVSARVVANMGFVSELMDHEAAKRYAKLLRRVGNVNVRVVRYG